MNTTDTAAFNPGPLFVAAVDRQPAIAAAIHYLMTASRETLAADLAGTFLTDRFIQAPEELLALLLAADPGRTPDAIAELYRAALTVLRAAGIPEPAHGGFGPEANVYTRQAVALDEAAYSKCEAGVRCENCFVAYLVAVWVDHPAGRKFLCPRCIDRENARLAGDQHGYVYGDEPVKAVPGGVPDGARYEVHLYNGTGRGSRKVVCRRPQDAQYVALTERPWNNTAAGISVLLPAV